MLKMSRDSEVTIITDDVSKKVLDVLSFIFEDKIIRGKIVNVKTFKNLDEIFELVDYKKLGDFNTKEEALKYYAAYANKSPLKLCKLKKEDNDDELDIDNEVAELFDENEPYEQIKIGFSSTKILKVQLKNGEKAILKINYNLSNDILKNEYDKIYWLQNKIKCPKIYFWKETDKAQYFLMECMQGENSYMFDGIGNRLGKELKKFHSIDISGCKFNDIKQEYLLEKALNNLDRALTDILTIYPEETKDSLIKFLNENIPTDYVFNHGDYSMPNIIVDKNTDVISFIDLGDAGISTMYFDIYHAIKSLKMNKFDSEIKDFIEGYEITELNEKYIKWMTIIDKVLN